MTGVGVVDLQRQWVDAGADASPTPVKCGNTQVRALLVSLALTGVDWRQNPRRQSSTSSVDAIDASRSDASGLGTKSRIKGA